MAKSNDPAHAPSHKKMKTNKNFLDKTKMTIKTQKFSENQRSEADRINKLESSQRRVPGKNL